MNPMAASGTVPAQRVSRHLIPWMAFIVSVCVAIGLFFIPAFIIRPFRFQSPRELVLAMAVRQVAPLWAAVSCAASLLLLFLLWRRASTWKRSALLAGVCLACASAVMSRVDYFEWMFHPVPSLGFEAIDRSKLDSGEMVMAVRFAADARAYPIRAMAYHHVVNDVVGGRPIAVTY
jgi:Protein of unknown function (DUF3179)